MINYKYLMYVKIDSGQGAKPVVVGLYLLPHSANAQQLNEFLSNLSPEH